MKITDEKSFRDEVKSSIIAFFGDKNANDLYDSIYDWVKNDVGKRCQENYNGGDVILSVGKAVLERVWVKQ